MVKPVPVHSYDFNREGYVPNYCDSCGICSDIEEIIPDNHIVLTRLSNRFIERILKILCNRQHNFSYKEFKILEKRLKDRNIYCSYNLADLIVLEAQDFGITLDWDLVIHCIYAKSGAYLNLQSYA